MIIYHSSHLKQRESRATAAASPVSSTKIIPLKANTNSKVEMVFSYQFSVAVYGNVNGRLTEEHKFSGSNSSRNPEIEQNNCMLF